jgi:hypothetical protein
VHVKIGRGHKILVVKKKKRIRVTEAGVAWLALPTPKILEITKISLIF